MTDLSIFLINLDASPDRLAAATDAMAAQGTSFTRVSGYDGRKTNPLDVPEYDAAAMRAYFGRDMNGGEVGCCFSHIRALQAFVESGKPYGLIFEDDVSPAPQAMELTRALIEWQNERGTPDWYVANLGAERSKILSPVTTLRANGSEVVLYRGHYFPMLATALLWTREGACAFLEIALPLNCPYDNFLRRWLTANDMGLTTRPPLFRTTGADSDIDKSHTAKRRGTEGRSKNYGWLKAKRMWGDKFRALGHKSRRKFGLKGKTNR
ncbi:glycosyltransferase family 25 protein [Leisingera sp. ANG-Vp]|uniref:glycosyltransferase family 25 protein n=1 Tax=Leisingera sp. ANG-Vp TaxID=1577896 RepID=UPI00057D723F|nr:glycosyltransferase family 25 protein [Leisingera sp. ANG-Vp]KIC21043.1 hypothetical protein RA20_06075 [Leisingera sp. ANG-Vp]